MVPSEIAIQLARMLWAGKTDHNLWNSEWVCSVLHRRGTVIRYKTGNTKSLGVRFSALLIEGDAKHLALEWT